MLARIEAEQGGDGVRCGVSELEEGVAVVRILAARGLLLKKALASVREDFSEVFPLLKGGRRTL